MQRVNQTFRKKPYLVVIIAGVILLVAAFSVYYFFTHESSKAEERQTVSGAFSFDQQIAPGWSASSNIYPTDGLTDDFQGDVESLPVVSMNIFEGTQQTPGSCFVMYSYYDKPAGDEQSVAGFEASTLKGSEHALKLLGTYDYTMQTPESAQPLKIHQYYLEGGEKSNLSTGVQYGVVLQTNGYIEVKSYCETPDQLDKTLPVFRAVTLNRS